MQNVFSIQIKPVTTIIRKCFTIERFHEIIMSMPNPVVHVVEDYGYLQLKAWNKNGICHYHYTDNNFYDINKIPELIRQDLNLLKS